MRIKLDENLPNSLSPLLKKLGHDASTVNDEGLTGCADREIWQAAQREARFLITQDLDFSDTRQIRSWKAPWNSPRPLALAQPSESDRAGGEHLPQRGH